MDLTDFLMIVAVFFGPIVAVRLTRFLDNRKEIRERKLSVFKTLMATRAYTLSPGHVEALNSIDLEFDSGKKHEKKVLEAWKQYLDLLGDKTLPAEQWAIRRSDLLIELLYHMGLALDYDFDKTYIKNGTYFPGAHGEIEGQHKAIRQGVIEIMEGKRVLPMHVTNLPDSSNGFES